MNQEAAPLPEGVQVVEDKPKENPMVELIRNLTPDTSSRLKALILPPKVGVMFKLGPMVFMVGYINPGKMQFSSEFYGMVVDGGILRPGGAIESVTPAPHEQGRNPKNVTLDVHSGAIDGNAIFQRPKDGAKVE